MYMCVCFYNWSRIWEPARGRGYGTASFKIFHWLLVWCCWLLGERQQNSDDSIVVMIITLAVNYLSSKPEKYGQFLWQFSRVFYTSTDRESLPADGWCAKETKTLLSAHTRLQSQLWLSQAPDSNPSRPPAQVGMAGVTPRCGDQ